MKHWREIEHITDFNGKTVAKIEFDGYENFCITFTDGTELGVRERMQAGCITWDSNLYNVLTTSGQEDQ